MAWKNGTKEEQRLYLIEAVSKRNQTLGEACLELGICRTTGYKWWNRYQTQGAEGLRDQSRRPKSQGRALAGEVLHRLVELRHQHPTWGAKKLITRLRSSTGEMPCSVRTLNRWLVRFKLVKVLRRRLYHAVPVSDHRLTIPFRVNLVWTVDFKGVFRTQDGLRTYALTIRDLYSRYGLAVQLVSSTDDATVRRAFIAVFQSHGLPSVIRVDNGIPFAGAGPYGYSTLSLWWSRLGIKVEFTRPAKPCDNGSHEQFHRVYKRETLCPAAANCSEQQKRTDQWLRHYNEERPHEALQQRVPASFYQNSRRKYRPVAELFCYPKNYQVRRVANQGFLVWRGELHYISRIVARLKIGLKPITDKSVLVYIDKICIGSLHEQEKSMRPAKAIPYQKCTPCDVPFLYAM